MGQRRRVTVLGCDLGETNNAVAILGHGRILYIEPLQTQKTWDAFCVYFQDTLGWLIRSYDVQVLTVEAWEWYGHHAKAEPPVRELIGIARTFSRMLPVHVIPARTWSEAITGTKPKSTYFDESKAWKRTIRQAVTRHMGCMGIDLDAVLGEHANTQHCVDALGLSLFMQDRYHVQSFARTADIRR